MSFLTDFWNWRRPKQGQEVKQNLETKLSGTVGIGKRVAKDLRGITKMYSLKISMVTDLPRTIEVLNQGSCKLDNALANKHAKFDLAIVKFLDDNKSWILFQNRVDADDADDGSSSPLSTTTS